MAELPNRILKKIIPFAPPFLLIDEVLLYVPGKKIVAKKLLTGKEWFLKGHFPGSPIMPGHMIAESMVQTGLLLFAKSGYEQIRDKIFLLASSKVRFFKVVKPGHKLVITAYPVKVFSKAAVVRAESHVNGKLVAKGEFSVAIKKISERSEDFS